MGRELIQTGPGAPLTFTAVLIGSMYLLMASALPEVTGPRITSPVKPRIRADLGRPLVISCKADPGFPDDFTLIYWLANNQFIEMKYPDSRVTEADERRETRNQTVFIQRDLVFQNVLQEDFSSNYTCVVMSPAGINKITVHLEKSNRKNIHNRKSIGKNGTSNELYVVSSAHTLFTKARE